MTPNPYEKFMEGVEPLAALEETPRTIDRIVRRWPRARDEQPYAPGKWTARQILAHLAQAEMVFSTRLRFAVAEDGHVLQPFDQDRWIPLDASVPALDALDAYVAMRRLNLALCRALGPAQRARTVTHPQFGDVTVEWIMTFFAGHERNHLPQIEAIAGPA